MPDTFSVEQFRLVGQFFSLTIAAMGASALFFFFASFQLHPKHRIAVLVSAVVVTIACYHYVRIYESWNASYEIADAVATSDGGEAASEKAYKSTGEPFEDAYRYVDWLLTVPLLVVELVAVMSLPRKESSSLMTRLGAAAVLMIILGYPGESSTDAGTRWIWWGLSMVPFIYIVFVLVAGLSKSLESQPEQVRDRISTARYIILVTWLFYPVAYMIKTVSLAGTGSQVSQGAEVGIQIGYSVADILAKAAFGVYIYSIAAVKSELETGTPATLDGSHAAQ